MLQRNIDKNGRNQSTSMIKVERPSDTVKNDQNSQLALQLIFKYMNLPLTQYKRKQFYFTKSQNSLPIHHTPEQFNDLIRAKKQYQTLIKKELNALELIDNEENTLNKLSHNPSQQSVEPFQYDDIIKRQEKSSEQFISCFESLKGIKTRKYLKQLTNKLRSNQKKTIKLRASKYFFQNLLLKKIFNNWKGETIEQNANNNKQKIKQIEKIRYKQALKILINFKMHQGQRKQLQRASLSNKKKKGILSIKFLIENINRKVLLINTVESARLYRTFSCFRRQKINIQHHQIIQQKQKLIKNIFVHRRINDFIKVVKQLNFKQQKTIIVNQIVSKINLSQLLRYQSSLEQCFASSQTINTQLFNLMLQNFMQEYMQLYKIQLAQNQYQHFLNSLKIKCLIKFQNQKKIKNLYHHLKQNQSQIHLSYFITRNSLKLFFDHLKKMMIQAAKAKSIQSSIKKQMFKIFEQESKKSLNMKKFQTIFINNQLKSKQDEKKRNRFKIVILKQCFKKFIDLSRIKIKNKRNFNLHLDVAKQWYNSLLFRKILKSWKEKRVEIFQQKNLIKEITLEKDKQQQNGNRPQISQKPQIQFPEVTKQSNEGKYLTFGQLYSQQRMLQIQPSQKKIFEEQNKQQVSSSPIRMNKTRQQLSKLINQMNGQTRSKYSNEKSKKEDDINKQNIKPILADFLDQISQNLEDKDQIQFINNLKKKRFNEWYLAFKQRENIKIKTQKIKLYILKSRVHKMLQNQTSWIRYTKNFKSIEQMINKKKVNIILNGLKASLIHKNNQRSKHKIRIRLLRMTINLISQHFTLTTNLKNKKQFIMNKIKQKRQKMFFKIISAFIQSQHLQKRITQKEFKIKNYKKLELLSNWRTLYLLKSKANQLSQKRNISLKQSFLNLLKIKQQISKVIQKSQDEIIQKSYTEDESENILNNYLFQQQNEKSQEEANQQINQQFDQKEHQNNFNFEFNLEQNVIDNSHFNSNYDQKQSSDINDQKRQKLFNFLLIKAFKQFIFKIKFHFCQQTQIIKKIRKTKEIKIRRFFKIIEERQRSKIHKQQLAELISYNKNQFNKKILKKAFEILKISALSNQNLNIKQKCFSGLKIYLTHKKTVRMFLQMHQKQNEHQYSYFPNDISQKNEFEQLQKYT